MQKKVAYFCMEYAIDDNLHWYAGGLGVLAGDYLKQVKDENYPLVGIGLLWHQGYTEQYVDDEGIVYDAYKNYQPCDIRETGIEFFIQIRNRDVKVKVVQCVRKDIGELYLLDTYLEENQSDAHITDQLYGGFEELRLAQEMVLGIGGVRALSLLGIEVSLYHFNEGHAVFAGLELLRIQMECGKNFQDAWDWVKQRIVFTTHTPIKEGNESHPLDAMFYMGANLGLNKEQLICIGGQPFNMTLAALRLSKKANAVAKLHSITANKMWGGYEHVPEIIGITNAIHLPTWVDDKMIALALEATKHPKCKSALYGRHLQNKAMMIEFIRRKTGITLAIDRLIIGFARRAAPYKRSGLIFSDMNVIEPLLKEQKLQFVFSGKAHPLDNEGKDIIQNIVALAKQYPNSIVYLQNYDMQTGKVLTRGCDIWLNNPQRPKEASGTSGMKAAMNGCINLSVLDGWWDEACIHGVNGWQFGDGFESANLVRAKEHDAQSLYTVLLDTVLPMYYENKEQFIEMQRQSILTTYQQYNMSRMLKEYHEQLYHET